MRIARDPGKRPGDGLRARRVTYWLRVGLTADANAVVEKALAKTIAELGPRSTPADAIRAVAELALLTDPEGEAPGRARTRSSPYTVVIHRRDVGNACGGGEKAWIDGKAGPAPMAPEVVEEAMRRGAKVIETKDLAPLGE